MTMKIYQHPPKGSHTHNKNLNALQLKKNYFCPLLSVFLFCEKSFQKKSFSPMTKKILQHQPKGQAPQTVKISVHCNFDERCNYNI